MTRKNSGLNRKESAALSSRNTGKSPGDWALIIEPTQYSDKYGADEQQKLASIINWMNENKKGHGWMATASDINRSMYTQIIGGYYTGRVTQKLDKILDTIEQINARASVLQTPFITTSVSKVLTTGCKQARKNQMFAVLAANVGTGKTRTLREYAANNAHTYLIEADPQMSPSSMIEDIVRLLEIRTVSSLSVQAKFRLIVDTLKTVQSPLVIMDEAELATQKTLEYLRRLRDKAGCGVVLAGTTRLYTLISPHGGSFDQIRSRTIFFPKPITHITKNDTARILYAAFDDRPEIFNADEEVESSIVNAMYSYTNGSIRMLVENLIPAIRDYGIPQHGTVSVAVIHAVAKDVLSLG